jgi:pimeloyl-ACP methyl ester carboxylesterase
MPLPSPNQSTNHNIPARGTSEPGAFGSVVGDPLVARVKRDLAGSRGYPVQYPADALGMGGVLGGAGATAHSAIGPNDILYRIGNQTKECPDEKFALVGYSQGGSVVLRAAPLLKARPELAAKVVATVLYGAGDGKQFVLPQSILLANCARGDLVGA